jgi:hypothetical protein
MPGSISHPITDSLTMCTTFAALAASTSRCEKAGWSGMTGAIRNSLGASVSASVSTSGLSVSSGTGMTWAARSGISSRKRAHTGSNL